jgi:uncharacterized protein (TIGR02145 family)
LVNATKQLNNSTVQQINKKPAVKKLFTLTAVFLLGTVCFAQTSSLSSVNVRPITADYAAATPTVTFEVTWPDDRDDNHRSKVWVFVDYRRIKDNAYVDGWLRADITVPASSITATVGTPSREDGNTSGFWLQGTEGAFAATVTVPVTVDLNGYAPQFGWCGWAIDRPSYAEETTGGYTLYGTPDFIIQTHPTDAGSTVSQSSQSYDNCIYGLTDATGAPGEWPVMPAISDFTASTTTICAGESVTLTATAINAQRYSFDNGVTWDNSSSTVVSPLTTTDYILKASREKGACTVTSANTITVNPAPSIQLTSGTASQTVDLGTAITTIVYTATNATGISVGGSLPPGVSGAAGDQVFTISGTPTVTGTFGYTISASYTVTNCTSSAAGTITVTTEPPTDARSAQAWLVTGQDGAQIWSDAINIPNCNKTDFYARKESYPDCRNNGNYGYLYSGLYVRYNASVLCPDPWRVPTKEDFEKLIELVRPVTLCKEWDSELNDPPAVPFAFPGMEYAGICNNSFIGGQGEAMRYWSQSYWLDVSAYCLHYHTEERCVKFLEEYNDVGSAVRCVK